jgi:hypothetical protein
MDFDSSTQKKYSFDLWLDEAIGAPRFKEVAPASSMYGKYWYRSSLNSSMANHLKGIADDIMTRVKPNPWDIWLDIACNDGALLKNVPQNFIKIGIDPADESYYAESSIVADQVIQDFFTTESFGKSRFSDRKCKVITSIAMFYDLDDPHQFVRDINEVLDDDGLWVMQISYTPLMIKQLAFDNICAEHIYYHSLSSIKKILDEQEMKIVDCSLNDCNGGSIRVFIQKNKANTALLASAPLRDVWNYRVKSILHYEKTECDISNPDVWSEFEKQMGVLRNLTMDLIKDEVHNHGKTVYGYGASTKGNTLLQYFGLDSSLITAIAECSHYKFGLKTIGTDIPIISEMDMRQNNPDYLLILPWHFIDSFITREKAFLQRGGKFIVPCPKFEIIRSWTQ